MNSRVCLLLLILLSLAGNNLAATYLDDDFESYADSTALAARWHEVFWGGNNEENPSEVTISRSLDITGGSNGSRAMRMSFTFNAGVAPTSEGTDLGINWIPCIYGVTGYYISTGQRKDLTDYTGVSLWIKPEDISGNEAYFKLFLIEGSGTGGKRWMSPEVVLSGLDSAGEYITLNFDDFYQYYKDVNASMNRTKIKNLYLYLAYDNTATENSLTSILIDDITLIGESIIVRPPYLQNVTQTSVKVMWGSNSTNGIVYWGSSLGNYTDSVSSVVLTANDGSQIHTATIAGLSISDTIYYYVKNGIENIGYNDAAYYAITAPADDALFRFAFYSDSHAFNTMQGAVINSMIAHNPDIVLHGGDKVTTGKNISEFNDYFFYYGAPLMKNTPSFHTVGNHDMTYPQSGNGYEADIENYRALFDLPVNNSSYDSTEDYYSFDYGSVHFVSIHAQRAQSGGYQSGYYNPTYNDSMLAWLKRDLQATDKPWKVVFFHKPIFMNWLENQGWDTIMENNGVQLVLNGHLHYYYAHLRNSVTYVIAAGGGSGIGTINWWEWTEYSIGAFRDNHSVQVDVTPEKLFLNVYDDNNNLRHWIEIGHNGDVIYPQIDLIDDFEGYNDTGSLQGTWALKYIPSEFEDLGVTFERSLASGGDTGYGNVMQLDFGFPAGSKGAWGSVGLSGLWNWSTHKGISLWIKAGTTGDTDQNYQIRIFEAGGGDKWVVTMPVSELNMSGEYVTVYFKDFEWYDFGNSDSSLANNIMDLDNISAFHIGASASPDLATDNSTSTILVDDITAILNPTVSTHLDDDFESYADNNEMLAKWSSGPFWGANINGVDKYEPPEMTVSRNLSLDEGSGESNAIQIDITVNAGVVPITSIGGNVPWEPIIYTMNGFYVSGGDRKDLTNYEGIRFWVKPGPMTGDGEVVLRLAIEESGSTGQDRWMSPKVYVDSLDLVGEYIEFGFDKFFEYFRGSGQEMDRTSLNMLFIWLTYETQLMEDNTATVWVDEIEVIEGVVSVVPQISTIPEKFALLQNYPNPFNPVTTIRYNLPEAGNVKLIIYDILGREIVRLVDDRKAAGPYSTVWNGRDQFGKEVATGIYIYRLNTKNFSTAKKLVLMK